MREMREIWNVMQVATSKGDIIYDTTVYDNHKIARTSLDGIIGMRMQEGYKIENEPQTKDDDILECGRECIMTKGEIQFRAIMQKDFIFGEAK